MYFNTRRKLPSKISINNEYHLPTNLSTNPKSQVKDSKGLILGSFKRTMPRTDSLLTGCSHNMCPAVAATWTLSTHQAEGSSNITLTACQAEQKPHKKKKL